MIREWLIDAALFLNRVAQDEDAYCDDASEVQEGLLDQLTREEAVLYLERKGMMVPHFGSEPIPTLRKRQSVYH